MMIPFWEYLLGTGPIFFLGLLGAIVSIIRRDRQFQPLIFWVIVTFAFAILFTHLKEQSPLRFTQTGLFIPLGILGAYFFYRLFSLKCCQTYRGTFWKTAIVSIICLYLLENLLVIKSSLDWQITWISQRIRANIPLVPYPPQTMYPLKEWMNGIRWLKYNTMRDEVVLAQITAGSYIPAYAGNTVYFGQSNTVEYEKKQSELILFFQGKMTADQAKSFLQRGRIKYIFFSVQEKELAGGKELTFFYPFLKTVF